MIINTFTIKNRDKEIRLFNKRLTIAIMMSIILSFVLLARLFFLQTIKHQHFTTLSNNNKIDIKPIEPRRGIIYDRNGIIIAKNMPVFSLMLTPYKVKNLKKTLTEIQKILIISEDDLEPFYKQYKQHRAFEEIPLKLKLTDEEVARFEVNQYKFPGLSIKAQLIRFYPFGSALSHVLGYVGRINQEELNSVNPSNYAASNFIGKLGVEKFYENELHGAIGYKKVETNAAGATIQNLTEDASVQGKNIYLTIDSQLQIAAEKTLDNLAGSVVAIDPNTGEILALVSTPSYDPNLFVHGISHKTFQKLRKDNKHPLYNRSIRGLYAPGSTIKPFIALEGLNSGKTTARTKIFDPGWYKLPNSEHVFHDWAWKSGGRGLINLSQAIVYSCDTYFYDLAFKLGVKRIDEILTKFGFGKSTQIDMNEELKGNIPTPKWKLKYRGSPWYNGDTVLIGIGQSYMLTTPLQLAMATGILANRGKHFQTRLLHAIQEPDHKLQYIRPLLQNEIKLKNSRYWFVVLDAMRKVITQGTGHRFGRNTAYTLAAKTGTAQVYSKHDYDAEVIEKNIPEKLRNNSIFIALAPFDNPEIAIAVVVEHSPEAPLVARKVMDYYFKGKHS